MKGLTYASCRMDALFCLCNAISSAEYDTFLSDLKKYGVDECIDLKQSALEGFYAK